MKVADELAKNGKSGPVITSVAPKMCLQMAYFKKINGFVSCVVALLARDNTQLLKIF